MPSQFILKAPNNLRCNAFVDPIGIGDIEPFFSWQCVAGPNFKLMAYEIEVASTTQLLRSGKADLWKSRRVAEPWANQARYAGKKLQSRQKAVWRVRVWGAPQKPSPWSRIAAWEIGLLEKSDWAAKWIASPLIGSKRTAAPAPHFRSDFSIEKNFRSARLHIAALGVFDCEINGKPVSEDVFAPGWTNYRQRIPSLSYDVSNLLKKGDNAIGVILGDGWYSGHIAWQDRQYYGDRPALIAQLEIEYADGSVQRVATDRDWLTRPGPILEADMIMGESYDARLDLGDWSSPGYDDSDWQTSHPFDTPSAKLLPAEGLPVRRQEILTPKSQFESAVNIPGDEREGVIFDFGQNFTGRVRIKVKGAAGACIRLRYGEMLQADNQIYTDNLRSANATDHYTLCGKPGGETWEPRFTFHGFRYLELVFPEGDVAVEKVEGVVLHNEMPSTGTFSCSHPLVNQLQRNIVWGQKSNFLEAPTDCPQRDERLGWTGDAQVFVRTAAFNRDVQAFFRKWSRDLREAQGTNGYIPSVAPNIHRFKEDGGPAWSDAHIICPWTMYLEYGDVSILEAHYDSMRKYLQHLISHCSKNWIRSHPDLDLFHGYGDWLAIDGSLDRFGHTPKDLIGTAFLAHDASLMAKIADLLGKQTHAAEYRKMRRSAETAFNDRFVTPDGSVLGSTQTAYILALHFDLLPKSKRKKAVNALVQEIRKRDYHLSTGFVGTPYICHVLTRFGHADLAYRLLEQETFPSWLLPVKNGATTMWERWDSWTPENGFGDVSMNSFNHYAYGAIGEWLYSTVAGLSVDEEAPGYRRIRFSPTPGGSLKNAEASLLTPRGKATIKWSLKRGALTVRIEVPPNAEGLFSLSDDWTNPTAKKRTANAKRSGSDWILASGSHSFVAKRKSS